TWPTRVTLTGCNHRQGPNPRTQPDSAMHRPMLINRQIVIIRAPWASLLRYTHGTNRRHTRVDRSWLKQYPPGVPADIDPDSYASLKEVIEEAFAQHRPLPAFSNMGATLTYAQLDELSRAFAAW